MSSNKKNILLTVLVFVFSSILFCQNKHYDYRYATQPFLRYYSPKEYKSSNTNWSIVQDQRGVMYFGNSSGVLEFDGSKWRRIKVPNSAMVRSITIDDNGIIYVCASSDFGYLEADSIGQLNYKSLKSHLNLKNNNSKEIWDVIANSKGVYFKTDDQIFRWNGKDIKVLDSVYSFRFYKIEDHIYARNNGTGLMKIDGDSVYVMPDGGYFSSTGVFDMLSYKDNSPGRNKRMLITTNYKGLFLHDGQKFSPFKTEADSFLINNQIYNACILADGNYAFATQRGGVAIVDQYGHLIKIIDESSGLPTNVVYDVYPDRQGGLWIATANGIVHCEVPSLFSIISRQDLLKEQVSQFLRFGNTLYAVNNFGVLYLDNANSVFKLVKDSNKPGMGLIDASGVLLAATNWGVGIVEKNNQIKMITDNSTDVVTASKFFKDRYYAGHREGLQILQKKPDQAQFDIYSTVTIEDGIYSIVEDAENSLWLLSTFDVLIHITDDLKNLSSELNEKINYIRYTKETGLPGNLWSIHNINDRMLLTTDKGVFRFSHESGTFVPDSTFGVSLSDSTRTISLIEKSINNDLWILSETKGHFEFGKAILQKNGRYLWQLSPEFNRLDLSTVTAIYSEYDSTSNKEILWFSTEEGLVKYDPNIYKNTKYNYSTLIRKVLVTEDSLIYGGSELDYPNGKEINLVYSNNDIRFEFSAVSFDKSEANLYQYYLEGADDNWSSWTNETKKDYTNLPEGDYKFRVRAKNIYQYVSREAVYNFTILPPWWRSWWAYGVYALLLGMLIFIVDRVQRQRLIKKERERAEIRETTLRSQTIEAENKMLQSENKRKELELRKTKELEAAYTELKNTHENLKATQQQLVTQQNLASLGALTAGIAHEIKNPLNFVNNFSEISGELLDEMKAELQNDNIDEALSIANDLKHNLEKINQHGKRADSIVKEMLLHSRGTSGEKTLTDINYLLDQYVNLAYHGMRAQNKEFNIAIEKDYDESLEKINVVPQDISRVFLNIINNACYAANEKKQRSGKDFAPTLNVSTKKLMDKVEIRIRDNGNGIPDSIKKQIFNPFFTTKPTGEGTGLGLSLSFDIIVKQHLGNLDVNSIEGEFTEFIITLPKT